VEKFVERATRHLRDALSITYEFLHLKEIPFKTPLDITLGDIIPPSCVFNDGEEIEYLIFDLLDYENVEDVILQINKDVYGESLVEIPDEKKNYIIIINADYTYQNQPEHILP
jgi:hypothetical protein